MTEQELQKKYPAYSKSIFSDFKPDNEEVLGWKQNVLQKIKGKSILPHYIEKNRDFDTFWGWITHFFATIVYFGRNFKKFFINYEEYLNEIGEFMREKDYIQDSRVKINKDLKVSISEEVYYKINIGQRLVNGIVNSISGYDCSDFIVIKSDNFINLSIGGYNKNINEFSGQAINNINIAYFDKNKNLISYISTSLTSAESIDGKKIQIPNNSNIAYFKVSYPRLGSANLPLYLKVYREGIGGSVEESKSEKDIFSIYKDFRKRGTFKGNSLIRKVLETKQEDNFYADYLPQGNSGWFLNQSSPTIKRLSKNVKIDSFCAQSLSNSGYNSNISLKAQYFILNQNTSIIIKWKGNYCAGTTATFNISVYDKNKNLLTDTPILGNWTYDSSKKIIRGGSVGSLVIVAKRVGNWFEAELPINIIDNEKSAVFSADTYNKDTLLEDNIYLFTKFNNSGTKEAYYLKINSVSIYHPDTITYPYLYDNANNQLLDSVDIGLYLKNLPITFGFLNNKKYYLCCFKNNGTYSNAQAKEIISQKIIPYDGYRLFLDNAYYNNEISVPLDLKDVYFNKITKKIHLDIVGGVPPYTYKYDSSVSTISYLQNYEKSVNYGTHLIKVVDSLGKSLLAKVSCQPYNDIDYRFKLYVSKDNSIQVFIKLFGGTETSYNISKYSYTYPYLYDNENNQLLDSNSNELLTVEISESTGNAKKIVPANVWIDITDIIGNNFSQIVPDVTLYIRDNGIPREETSWLLEEYNDLELNIQDLFKDFALDFYDNGKGELLN